MATTWCNAYGMENPGDAQTKMAGGLITERENRIRDQWSCDRPAIHRFRWTCEHGHRGPIVNLCQRHFDEFSGHSRTAGTDGRPEHVAYNMRRDVRVCPRCASMAESPELQHKCEVRLVTVS